MYLRAYRFIQKWLFSFQPPHNLYHNKVQYTTKFTNTLPEEKVKIKSLSEEKTNKMIYNTKNIRIYS